jgi:hypothetical protein
MVLLKPTVLGLAVLILGMLLLTTIGQYVTVQVQEVRSHDVEPHAQFLVGDIIDRTYSLPGGSEVFGVVGVTEAASNQAGDINFTVVSPDIVGARASPVYSAQERGQFNFTFTTGKSGVYHFVFDNRNSLYKKTVTLSVAYNEVITSRVPDTRVVYVAWILIAAGGIALAYGLVRKPDVTWN